MGWYDQFKEEKILVHQGVGHNKFWAAHYDPQTCSVHVRWGRLGTKGQSQEKHFPSEYRAGSFIADKYHEKRRKGYIDRDEQGRQIDHARFEEMCIEAAIVGTANKCHKMRWVEVAETGDFAEISDERLYDPECNPGLLVQFETRGEFDNRSCFNFLFTFDKTYDVRDARRAAENQVVTASHPLYKLTQKVEEAIGRKLSA